MQAALDRQKRDGTPGKFLKLMCNYKGHSYTSRLGHASLPKALYSDPEVFERVMAHSVEESLFMVNEGLTNPHTKKQHFMITLNLVGDWAWLHRAGNLCRTYNNMVKTDVTARGARPHARGN